MTIHVVLNHRGDSEYKNVLYVGPLEELLTRVDAGSVSGSGILYSDEGEPLQFEIEVEAVGERADDAGGITSYILTELNAPFGSSATDLESGERWPIGAREGLAVYLDGVGLKKSTYQKYGLADVMEAIDAEIGSIGSIGGSWTGPTESAVYIYGGDGRVIRSAIQSVVSNHPLGVGARLVEIAWRDMPEAGTESSPVL